MLTRILPLLAAICFFIPLKSQTVFYESGIDSAGTQKLYEKAMFALINSEHKKFYALAEEVIKKDPDCFKIKAHCAFQTFQVTKGAHPFNDIAKLALDTGLGDAVDNTYFEVLKNKTENNLADISIALLELAEKNPSVEIYFLLGNYYVEINDLKTAHKYFFRAFRLKNDFPPILALLAQTSEELGHETLAEDFLNRYIKALPENPKAHEVFGNYLSGKGKYAKAIDHFKKAYELDPNYAFALEKAKKLRGRFSEK